MLCLALLVSGITLLALNEAVWALLLALLTLVLAVLILAAAVDATLSDDEASSDEQAQPLPVRSRQEIGDSRTPDRKAA